MKKFAFAALVAVPVFAGLVQIAEAQNRYCCGDNLFAGEMVVTIETVISNRPRPGYETGVHLLEGAVVQISHCDELDWCHLEYPIANAYVPRHCLRPVAFNRYRGDSRSHRDYRNRDNYREPRYRGGANDYDDRRDRRHHFK